MHSSSTLKIDYDFIRYNQIKLCVVQGVNVLVFGSILPSVVKFVLTRAILRFYGYFYLVVVGYMKIMFYLCEQKDAYV